MITGKWLLALCGALSFLTLVGPAWAGEKTARAIVANSASGVVVRNTLTLVLSDGTTRTFPVKNNVSLDYADNGDEVRVTLERDEITSIKVMKERK